MAIFADTSHMTLIYNQEPIDFLDGFIETMKVRTANYSGLIDMIGSFLGSSWLQKTKRLFLQACECFQ
jgi:hypothetical protein